MAQALNSLFKAECIRNPVMRPQGGWKNVTDVEIAIAEYVDWFNHRRLHGQIGLIPPAEFESNHWASITTEHYPEAPDPEGAGFSNRASTKPGAIQKSSRDDSSLPAANEARTRAFGSGFCGTKLSRIARSPSWMGAVGGGQHRSTCGNARRC